MNKKLFELAFEMGYDHARNERTVRLLASDHIPLIRPQHIEEGWDLYQERVPRLEEYTEDAAGAGSVRSVEVDLDGVEPFDTGTLTFSVDTQKVGLNEVECSIELLSFETRTELGDGGVFGLTLNGDFTDGDA